MLIRKLGESTWHAPTITAYSNEQAIQTIIKQSPDLLPGSTGRRMAIVTELAIPNAGYVDVVGVDADGSITLVECKLKANPEIRRHVVGQVLAYAAGLWALSYEAFDLAFSDRAGVPLAKRMGEPAPEDWNEEGFRASLAANLMDGRFRLLIVVDQITEELERIVRYLNQHTGPELRLLALELGYVADEGVEILLPAVYGQESIDDKPQPGGHHWDEASVFAALDACCSAAGLELAKRLYEFAKQRGAGFGWGNGVLASVTAQLPVGGKPVSVFSLYEWPKGKGLFAINFEYLAGYVSGEALKRLADRLIIVPGAAEKFQGLEEANYRKRPSLLLDKIAAQPDVLKRIEDAFDELMGESAV